jgi:hypothetical protein
MGIRFYKKIRIFRNFYLNISKSGISFSFGERGRSLNLSTRGVNASVGLPGTGLSYRKRIYKWTKPGQGATPNDKPDTI